jgi:Kef-type K+ transport system membrane component KefB
MQMQMQMRQFYKNARGNCGNLIGSVCLCPIFTISACFFKMGCNASWAFILKLILLFISFVLLLRLLQEDVWQ